MFAILTATDFLAKLRQDFQQLEAQIDDSSLAMNCILSAYHIHEWVWARWLKSAAPISLRGTLIRSKADFVKWLDAECPYFDLIQKLANGAKHCSPVVAGTSQIAGYGSGPYGVGPYGRSYLLIDLGATKPLSERWLVASEMLGQVTQFWEAFFADHGSVGTTNVDVRLG